MCVKPEALLSGLKLRVDRGEVALAEDHVKTLLAAGCTPEAIKAAFFENKAAYAIVLRALSTQSS